LCDDEDRYVIRPTFDKPEGVHRQRTFAKANRMLENGMEKTIPPRQHSCCTAERLTIDDSILLCAVMYHIGIPDGITLSAPQKRAMPGCFLVEW
jgi:hypothetical protein